MGKMVMVMVKVSALPPKLVLLPETTVYDLNYRQVSNNILLCHC